MSFSDQSDPAGGVRILYQGGGGCGVQGLRQVTLSLLCDLAATTPVVLGVTEPDVSPM